MYSPATGSHHLALQEAHRIEMERISPDIRTGLGRYAVLSRLRQTFYEIREDYKDSSEYEAISAEELERSRQQLRGVPESQRLAINRELGLQNPSDFLRSAIGLERHTTQDAGADYVSALTEKTVNGDYTVADQTFLNFLEWHNHSLAAKQRALDKESVGLKSGYVQAMGRAVGEGWLPQAALGRAGRVDSTPVIADDGFLTTVRGTDGHAQYESGSYTVRMAPGANKSELQHREWHEFTHVTEGKSDGGESPDVAQGDRGLRRLFGDGYGGEVMNEALVEHVNHSLIHGNVDATNPADENRKGAVYRINRSLQHVLLTAGVRPIDIRLVIQAHYEDGDGPAQQAYADALHEAFPFTNVVEDIRALERTDDGLAPAVYGMKLMEGTMRYLQRAHSRA